jgi:hypothetical protein
VAPGKLPSRKGGPNILEELQVRDVKILPSWFLFHDTILRDISPFYLSCLRRAKSLEKEQDACPQRK